MPGTAGGPDGRAGSELMRRSVASVFLVCLMFECIKATASVREGKEVKVAYVIRREPETENVINPKRKKGVSNQRMFPVRDGRTSSENPSMRADV